jgi:hypothetical protein
MKSKLLSLAMMLLPSLTLIMLDSGKAMAQPRARFEVTLTRVQVNRQSLENAVEFAGAGDEVSFSRVAILHNIRTGSRVLSDGLNFTQTYGEQPPNDIRLGNASRRGGLKTGDDVTLPTPVKLFSEELIQGESAATIIVSVWEMDGPRDLYDHYKDFLDNYRPDMERIALRTLTNSPQTSVLLRDWDNSFTGGGSGPIATVVTLGDGFLGLGEAKDRPIGMIRQGNTYNFIPKLMILNFDNASRAAQTNQGSGLGVIKISYTDDQRLAGDYTLYVKIRRV